jgi:uncharacterized membrane protein YbhN (UPF0104 family)
MASELPVNRLRRAFGSLWIRVFVTVGLLVVVALRVNWGAAAHRVSAGLWSWFAVAVALLLATQVIGAVRWLLLLRAVDVQSPWPQVLRAYAIGVFTNNFLPTSFGGDAARAWIVARSGPRLVRSLMSVAVDRVTGLWCLLAVAWIALPTDLAAVPGSLVVSLLAATAGGVLAAALLYALAVRPGRGNAQTFLRKWAREARDALRLYVRNPLVLGAASALGLVFQAIAISAMWSLARAINLDLPFSLLAVAAPLILLITLVPISIAGFGVREGGTILVLGVAGVSATDATLLSLTGVAALVIAGLPGATAMILPGPSGLDAPRPADTRKPNEHVIVAR